MALERVDLGLLETRLLDVGLRPMRDEPMALHTSYRIGGPADMFVSARSAEALAEAIRAAVDEGVTYRVLGSGTNVLFGDRGFRGLIIRNSCDAVRVKKAQEGRRAPARLGVESFVAVSVYVEAGVGLPSLVRQMVADGWGGLTWAEGIPGTVGGAIIGNAGAYGMAMADVTREVDWLDETGDRGSWDADALQFGYRTSRCKGQRGLTVLGAHLELIRQDSAHLRREKQEYARRRRLSQPGGLSAGSVFKNPVLSFAGRLIEEAGLKGRRIGGAHISEKHANFIINDGDATAGDVRALIELAQEEVFKRFGFRLEPEIELVGEF